MTRNLIEWAKGSPQNRPSLSSVRALFVKSRGRGNLDRPANRSRLPHDPSGNVAGRRTVSVDHFCCDHLGHFILPAGWRRRNSPFAQNRRPSVAVQNPNRVLGNISDSAAPAVAFAPPPGDLPILTANGIGKAFGGVTALSNVSMTVEPGKVHALIGPNGAGKTTLVNIMSGFYRPDRGAISIDAGATRLISLHHAARLGVVGHFRRSNCSAI